MCFVTGLALLCAPFSATAEKLWQPAPAAPAPADAAQPDWRTQMLAPSVGELLDVPYLSEEEKRALRVKHGVWTVADLEDRGVSARAAFITGRWGDRALEASGADPLDLAEALVLLGESFDALTALDENAPRYAMDNQDAAPSDRIRAIRVRAAATALQGKRDDAAALLAPVIERLNTEVLDDAEELVECVRAAALFDEIKGLANPGEGFQQLMGVLARVRTELDASSWSARLTEAELLYAKDNLAEAGEALEQALSFNPSSARAWHLAGLMAVDGLDVRRAIAVARRLDELAGLPPPPEKPPEPAQQPEANQPDPAQPEPVQLVDMLDAARAIEESTDERAEDAGRSPLGALVLARMRLRQAEAEEAKRLLEAAAFEWPASPDVLAWRAAAVAGAFDFDAARARLAELDAMQPGQMEGYFAVGRVLSERRQYAEASTFLQEAIERAPWRTEPLIEHGLMLLQAGDDVGALAALEKAAERDTFNVRAANSLTLARELQRYERLETPNFVIRFNPDTDALLASEMPGPLEQLYARVTGAERGGIDYKPPVKTTIDLMPDHRWFAVRIVGLPGIHTIAASTGPVIAMESPREGPSSLTGAYDWVRVVRHEFVHTVTLARTRNRLPHWFTEASAVYLEDAPRDFSAWQLLARSFENAELLNMQEINIAFARPRRPTDRQLAYAQGAWMYEFILERFGARAPLDLMDQYAAGKIEDAAMHQVLGLSQREFFEAFKPWASEQLVRVGMRLAEGMPSVQELADALDEQADGGEELTLAQVEAWLGQHPNHPDLLNLAIDMTLEAKGGQATPEMIPLLERYAEARPVDPLPHKLLARLYLDGVKENAGDNAPESGPVAAIPHLEFLDAREQHTGAFAMELARRYAATGDWTRAWTKAERATQISPYEPRGRELAASVAIKRADWPAAERHIRALMSIEPDRALHQQRLKALEAMRDARPAAGG
ncbi:MAG: hypothetical protein SFZ23_12610 [Planctomycetota bacterium]|nr:hypothetical protein [Planctomycetota bacterium]